MKIGALAFSVGLSLGNSTEAQVQSPPPWLGIHLLGAPGRVSGEYDCEAGRVVIDIDSPGFADPPRVVAWRIGEREISPSDLERWNNFLGEITTYKSFVVTCRGEWVSAGFEGFVDSSPVVVSVIWRNGMMWRLPPNITPEKSTR